MINIEDDKNLLRILTEQSGKEYNYVEEIRKLKQNAMKNEIIIPVIGAQGVGKSSLLNAVIGEEILPNEADETTCVPVEIRYAAIDSVVVRFMDGTIKKDLCTKDDLSLYVDNNYNPGNEKKVDKIIVYRHYPILKEGMVFVDLPGVGSLTQSNEKTTRDYLKKMCVAMFVISSESSIKKTEARFIRLIWGAVSSIFFVENIWDDQTEEDVVEVTDYNKIVLKQIASELKLKYIPEVIDLNAYRAALGTYRKDNDDVVTSGLPRLLAVLEKFRSNYKNLLEMGFAEKVLRYVGLALENINEKINNAKLTTEELDIKLQKENEEFSDNNQKIQIINNDIKTYLAKKKEEMDYFAKKVADETGGVLKADIYNRIDAGLVDGEELQRAFEDLQNVHAEVVFDKIKDEFVKIEEDLRDKLKDLEDLIDEEAWNPNSVSFHKSEALKWEKGVDMGFKLGGAFAGYLAYGSLGGPAGLIAAGVAYAVFSFFGNKVKEKKMDQRKRQTKEQIKPYIAQFERIIIESVTKQYANLEETVNNNLNNYINDRKLFSEKMKANIDTIKKEAAVNRTQVEVLQKDQLYLKEWLGKQYEY